MIPGGTQKHRRFSVFSVFFQGKRKPVLVCSLSLLAVVSGGSVLWYNYRKYPLSGEVFLQLENGQVQYAPAASVYIFSVASPRRREWFDAYGRMSNDLAEEGEEMQRMIAAGETARTVRVFQESSHNRLTRALQEATVQIFSKEFPVGTKGSAERYLATCDSAGRFTTVLPRGSYLVVVTGRAGSHEAVWFNVVYIPENQQISMGEPVL